jgi:hypothetical protein
LSLAYSLLKPLSINRGYIPLMTPLITTRTIQMTISAISGEKSI